MESARSKRRVLQFIPRDVKIDMVLAREIFRRMDVKEAMNFVQASGVTENMDLEGDGDVLYETSYDLRSFRKLIKTDEMWQDWFRRDMPDIADLIMDDFQTVVNSIPRLKEMAETPPIKSIYLWCRLLVSLTQYDFVKYNRFNRFPNMSKKEQKRWHFQFTRFNEVESVHDLDGKDETLTFDRYLDDVLNNYIDKTEPYIKTLPDGERKRVYVSSVEGAKRILASYRPGSIHIFPNRYVIDKLESVLNLTRQVPQNSKDLGRIHDSLRKLDHGDFKIENLNIADYLQSPFTQRTPQSQKLLVVANQIKCSVCDKAAESKCDHCETAFCSSKCFFKDGHEELCY